MALHSHIVKGLRQNKSLVLCVFLLLIFRGAIADWHPVPTGSMKPTILEGDVILQNKLAYDLKIPFTDVAVARLGEPQRGDIIVINSDKADKRLVKRLIGLPGDDITMLNNQLYINGEAAQYTFGIDSHSGTVNENAGADQNALAPLRLSDREAGIYTLESYDGMPDHVITINRKQGGLRGQFSVKVPEGQYFAMGDNRDNSADSRVYGFFSRKEVRGRATHTLLSLNILDNYKPRFERFFGRLM